MRELMRVCSLRRPLRKMPTLPNDTDQTFAVVWLIAECGESLSESLGGAIDEDSCLTELQARVTLASQLSKLLRAGSAYDGS